MTSSVTTAFLDTLHWRGLLQDVTARGPLEEHLASGMRTAYAGFDPTSDSLHIGHLIPITLLAHWQRAGHRPIVVVGGGTGLIGDPSGRDDERQLLDREAVAANVASQRRIFERLLDFDAKKPNAAVVMNNLDWLDELGYIEVLRDVGKYFSVNSMIQRESVRARLEEREQGISYTEFSYMILQAYDFLHLRRTSGCTTQVAGSDQYGNIVAGIDLIRRDGLGESFGVTAPLISRSDGRKMSKSSGQAVWLSADTRDATSPYGFYQYWFNLPDADVEVWLKRFTFLGAEEIDAILSEHNAAPHTRAGQRALARHMTSMIHGAAQLTRVEAASEALFDGTLATLDEGTLREVFADVPHSSHERRSLGEGVALVELLARTTLADSKRAAREHVGNRAISVNGVRQEADRLLTADDLLHGRLIILRRGKKHYHATEWA